MKTKNDDMKGIKRKRLVFRNITHDNDLPDIKPKVIKTNELMKLESMSMELNEGDKVSCLNDKAFKALIVNSKKPEYLDKLISLIFEISYEEALKKLVILKNEFDVDSLDEKSFRGDCIVQIDSNYIDLEVNRTPAEDRNMIYLDSLLDSFLNDNGKIVSPSSCSLINIHNYKYPGHEETVEKYMLSNKNGNLINFYKNIMNIYVPNILEKYYNGVELDELERWVFVMCITDTSVARKIGRKDGMLMELIDDSVKLKNDELFRDYYNKEAWDNRNFLEMGREEGHAEGRVEGREEGREEGIQQERKHSLESVKSLILSGIDKDLLIRTFKLTKEEQNMLDIQV